VRCGRCGNENAEGNRFCGMCGSPLTVKTQQTPPLRQTPAVPPASTATPRPNVSPTVREQHVPAPSATQPGTPTRPMGPMTQAALSSSAPAFGAKGMGSASVPVEARPQAPFDEDAGAEPTISGPSFLGLNQPGQRRSGSRHEGRRDTGHLQTSGNLDYLLDDEEPPKHGWGKLVFISVALALAGGFGYLHWKQGGFDWLTAGSSKPAATQPVDDATQKPAADNGGTAGTNAGAGAASNPSATVPSGTAAPSATGGGAAGTPVASSGNTSAPAAAPGAESASGQVPSAPASAIPTGTASPNSSQPTSPSMGSPQSAAQGNVAPNISATSGQAGNSQSSSGEAITPAAAASPGEGSAAQSSVAEQQPKVATASRKAILKSAAAPKPSPAKPVDSVSEAERYIYGRGVRQDCDHGLHMLKSAADRSDARAMISLGALYSTGATCTPRDLPTAYRYFAMGLHKQPDNQALQDDLQKLWSQMTQPERQLAIKLSQ
jgi:hypothetical protein